MFEGTINYVCPPDQFNENVRLSSTYDCLRQSCPRLSSTAYILGKVGGGTRFGKISRGLEIGNAELPGAYNNELRDTRITKLWKIECPFTFSIPLLELFEKMFFLIHVLMN